MVYSLKNNIIPCFCLLLASAALSGCGGGSSSSSTTFPDSETIAYAHNIVLFRNSTTLSTGYNAFGQLGTGDLKGRKSAGFLEKYYPFSGTATGGVHSVAFINNSTVRCWGNNRFGQLGNATTEHSTRPVKTVDLNGVTAVAAGAYHTLAIKNNDTVWEWGRNAAGQLEEGTELVPKQSTVPVKVSSGTVGVPFKNVSSIAANGYHSIARANGMVWVWGFNRAGQLGLDPAFTKAMASPVTVSGLPPVGISAIAAGASSNYAVAKDGTLWAWGNNDNGQLGNGTTLDSFTPVQVMKNGATPLTNVVQVAGGIQHGLARLKDGTLWAFGFNFYGQLGDNAKLDSSYAVQVVKDATGAPLTGVTDIRAFGSSSMAMINNTWYVWGDNAFGQLGIGSDGTDAAIVPLPVKMLGY